MTTLREHLERIIVRGYCPTKEDDRADAIAALAILNDAPRSWLASEGFVRRNVPDGIWPDQSSGGTTCS